MESQTPLVKSFNNPPHKTERGQTRARLDQPSRRMVYPVTVFIVRHDSLFSLNQCLSSLGLLGPIFASTCCSTRYTALEFSPCVSNCYSLKSIRVIEPEMSVSIAVAAHIAPIASACALRLRPTSSSSRLVMYRAVPIPSRPVHLLLFHLFTFVRASCIGYTRREKQLQ